MSERQKLPGRRKMEDIVGYSRMVKSGNQIWVSGTVAADDSWRICG